MLVLPEVTLCCVDTLNHRLALRALARSMQGVAFARCVLLTANLPHECAIPAGIEIETIAPLPSRAEYSTFMLRDLGAHVATTHALVVQWDGYVVNPASWSPEFLASDYLGAKWFWHDDGMRVGNGGFSLRSKRLLDAVRDPRIAAGDAEDVAICRTFRPLLEREYGIRFGDEALADRFSFEAAYPIGRPFGFHGLFNFCRVEPPDEIAALAPLLSDAIARSPQLGQLLRNCAALGFWNAVLALATRILAADPAAAEAIALADRARAASQRPAVVGRNDPCPCGSGRKYKQCHGALGAQEAPREASVDAELANAIAAHQRGELERAESGYRAVLERVPEHPHAMHYLGVILYQRRQWADALPLLERSATLVPQEPEFHNNLGLLLAAMDRNPDAMAAYRRALALKPGHAVAWNNLGLALTASNRLPEAVTAYRESIARAPQFGQAHWNLALALLAQGDFAQGWEEYEWRLALPELGGKLAPSVLPRWDGCIARGKTLLLTAEQGLGDAIQFARFARAVASQGMRVEIQVPAPLQHLLAAVPGVSRVYAAGEAPSGGDYQLPLLSIARALGVRSNTIPSEAAYLHAEPERRARLRAALEPYASVRRIGIAWAGNPSHANDRRRSIPFSVLQPLWSLAGAAWFSLQKDASVGAPLVEWSARNSMDDLAALASELDLIVAVDTSVAHLAAALGRPTWLLLPFAPDWRWGLEGRDSPWYPTMRLFRQPEPGDWDSVVTMVATALQELPSNVRELT